MLCSAAMPVAIVLASFPWVATGRHPEEACGQPYDRWDKAAKWTLQIAGLAGPALLLVSVLSGTGAFLFERQLGWGVIGVVVFAFCIGGLGNILAGVLFLVGVTLETYRRQWHVNWT